MVSEFQNEDISFEKLLETKQKKNNTIKENTAAFGGGKLL
jgi:hypothetical protein